jgi:hypothetical protein
MFVYAIIQCMVKRFAVPLGTVSDVNLRLQTMPYNRMGLFSVSCMSHLTHILHASACELVYVCIQKAIMATPANCQLHNLNVLPSRGPAFRLLPTEHRGGRLDVVSHSGSSISCQQRHLGRHHRLPLATGASSMTSLRGDVESLRICVQ